MMAVGAGRRVLIVEDEFPIALDIVVGLSGLGVIPLGPVPTLGQAMDLLTSVDRLDGAVLDVNLHEEMVFPLADALEARGVPFIFMTGYDERVIPARYARVELCQKPYHLPKLLRTVISAIDIAKAA
jgi:two-component SAPR family response regulator